MMEGKLTLGVTGLVKDPTFYRCKKCAEELFAKEPNSFEEPTIEGLQETTWAAFIKEKKASIRGEMWAFDRPAVVTLNGQILGGLEELLEWADEHFNFKDTRTDDLYLMDSEEGYKKHLSESRHDFVYLDISIGENPAGRLVFELLADVVPKTCFNFKALCTGECGNSCEGRKLSYQGSLIHRIVPNGWIQGGDIYNGNGDGGESVHGPFFEDENFAVSHSARGILGMANQGRHTNGSQFYVTLQPTTWMDTKYVAFGKLVEGGALLDQIEALETYNQRPKDDVVITACGLLHETPEGN